MQTSSVFRFELKDIGSDGTFVGYASTFGNEDLGGDIIMPGAFAKTIKENPEVPILWRHDEPIGVNRSAKEDSRGLRVEGELNLKVQKGAEAYELAKQKAVKGLSIGYDPITVDYSRADEGIRILKEVKLYEYSMTPFPMNEKAGVTSIKCMGDAEIEFARMEKFISKASLSPSERSALQCKCAQLLTLIATANSTKEAADDAAVTHQDDAPDFIHAALSEFRDDLKKIRI